MRGELGRDGIQLRKAAYQLHPMSLEARTWISENVHSDAFRWGGNLLVIKPEHIGLIVQTTIENELKPERDFEVVGWATTSHVKRFSVVARKQDKRRQNEAEKEDK